MVEDSIVCVIVPDVVDDDAVDYVNGAAASYGIIAVEYDNFNNGGSGDIGTDAIGVVNVETDTDTVDDFNGVEADTETVEGGVDGGAGANSKYRHDLKHANIGGTRTISFALGMGVDVFEVPIFLCKFMAFLMMAALKFSSNSELPSLSSPLSSISESLTVNAGQGGSGRFDTCTTSSSSLASSGLTSVLARRILSTNGCNFL